MAYAVLLTHSLHVALPILIVLEATGGLERMVTSAFATAGLPVVVVNPRQVRDCARATGQLAKTEALDARALADRKSTRLNSSHRCISYAVFRLKKRINETRLCHRFIWHTRCC